MTTTFVETAGDTDSTALNLSDIVTTAIFLLALVMLIAAVHEPCAEIYNWLTINLRELWARLWAIGWRMDR